MFTRESACRASTPFDQFSGQAGARSFACLASRLSAAHHPQPQFIFHHRIAGPECARRNVRWNAALRSDGGAVADFQVARGSHLSRENAAVSDARRSRKADLSAENRVLADLAGVPDQDQIVDFRAAANARFPDGGAIDAGIGLNFDVVLDHHRSMLHDLVPPRRRTRLANPNPSPPMTTPFCKITRLPIVHPSRTTVCECARKSSPIRVFR